MNLRIWLVDVDWPRAERPSPAAWRAWQTCLCTISTGPNHRLLAPLGHWTKPPSSLHQWYFSENERRLYHTTGDGTAIYTPVHCRTNRRPRFGYQYTQPNYVLPPDAQRTTTFSCGDYSFQHTGGRPTQIPIINPEPHWTIERIHYPSVMHSIARAIQCGTAFALCDGSFEGNHGTAAFVIQDSYHQQSRILGCHRTPGHPTRSVILPQRGRRYPCNCSSNESNLFTI